MRLNKFSCKIRSLATNKDALSKLAAERLTLDAAP